MKTVISASRRTDIPAFYLDRFIQSIKSGEIQVANPLYKKSFTQVDLRAESVEWIVFWSRNYKQFLKNRTFFSDYQLFFHFTIISHHRLLENGHLSLIHAIRQMEKLVHYYGPDRIIWRYDPIVFWKKNANYFTNYRKDEYSQLCATFSSMGIKRCYISFVTLYNKFRQRFKKKYPGLELVTENHKIFNNVLAEMRSISDRYTVNLYSCCNNKLIGFNTQQGSCISGNVLNSLSPEKRVSEAKAPTRPDCGCTKSIDIGDYIKQPCYYGCIYCYANPVL